MPAQIAAGTLPPAAPVSATEDCTVEGTRQRNSTPVCSCAVSGTGVSSAPASPSSGKRPKVVASTKPCNRRWRSPASVSRVESRAP